MRHLRASLHLTYAFLAMIALSAAEVSLAGGGLCTPTVCPNGTVTYDGVCPLPGSGTDQGACSVNGDCSVTTLTDCGTKKGIWLGATSVCTPNCTLHAFPGHFTVPFLMTAGDHAGVTAFTPVQYSWSIRNSSGAVIASGTSAAPLAYPLVVDGSVGIPYGALVPAANSRTFPDGFTYTVEMSGKDKFGRTCLYVDPSRATVKLPGLAVPPSGLAASVSNGVALTWKAVDPNLYALWDYTIGRSGAGSGPWTVVASRVNATSYAGPAGSLGGVVYFAVASQNQTGVGPYSAPISVTLPRRCRS